MSRLPLARHPLGQTHDPGRARELLAEHLVDHQLTAHDDADLNFHLNGLRLADSFLLAWTYGTAARIETTNLDTHLAVLTPMSGSLSIHVDDEDEFAAPPLAGAVISPPSSACLDLSADCVMVGLLLPRARIEAHVQACGVPEAEVRARGVQFEPRLDHGSAGFHPILIAHLLQAERAPGLNLN